MPSLQYVILSDTLNAVPVLTFKKLTIGSPGNRLNITININKMALPPQLKVGIGWVTITVTGPVDVIAGFKGYAPIVTVKVDKTGLDYILYISAKSLTEQLEPLRKNNGDQFTGLKFSIRKESEDKMAKYELKTD